MLLENPFDLNAVSFFKAFELFHHLFVEPTTLVRSASAPVRDELHPSVGAFNNDFPAVFSGERADERAALFFGFVFLTHFGALLSAFSHSPLAFFLGRLADLGFSFFIRRFVGLAILRLLSESITGKQACRRKGYCQYSCLHDRTPVLDLIFFSPYGRYATYR